MRNRGEGWFGGLFWCARGEGELCVVRRAWGMRGRVRWPQARGGGPAQDRSASLRPAAARQRLRRGMGGFAAMCTGGWRASLAAPPATIGRPTGERHSLPRTNRVIIRNASGVWVGQLRLPGMRRRAATPGNRHARRWRAGQTGSAIRLRFGLPPRQQGSGFAARQSTVGRPTGERQPVPWTNTTADAVASPHKRARPLKRPK